MRSHNQSASASDINEMINSLCNTSNQNQNMKLQDSNGNRNKAQKKATLLQHTANVLNETEPQQLIDSTPNRIGCTINIDVADQSRHRYKKMRKATVPMSPDSPKHYGDILKLPLPSNYEEQVNLPNFSINDQAIKDFMSIQVDTL